MIKKSAIFLLVILAILLVKDRPNSPGQFLHNQKVRISRISRQLQARVIAYGTEAKDVSLDIKFHRQEHSLSCEIASLKMALSYYGVNASEKDLLAQLPIDAAGPRRAGNVWGDPNKGFVGSVDGEMPNTGYGVYEKPIALVASKYRSSEALNDASLDEILGAVADKHPVIVWVPIADAHDISWKTPEGETVPAVYGEHARVLIGFSGSVGQPDHLFFMDPVYGRIRTTPDEFSRDWSKLGNRAVIIE